MRAILPDGDHCTGADGKRYPAGEYDYYKEKPVEKLLGVQDEDDEFEPQKGQPMLPQIEKYAEERGDRVRDGMESHSC